MPRVWGGQRSELGPSAPTVHPAGGNCCPVGCLGRLRFLEARSLSKLSEIILCLSVLLSFPVLPSLPLPASLLPPLPSFPLSPSLPLPLFSSLSCSLLHCHCLPFPLGTAAPCTTGPRWLQLSSALESPADSRPRPPAHCPRMPCPAPAQAWTVPHKWLLCFLLPPPKHPQPRK